jgi:hypothetical protein
MWVNGQRHAQTAFIPQKRELHPLNDELNGCKAGLDTLPTFLAIETRFLGRPASSLVTDCAFAASTTLCKRVIFGRNDQMGLHVKQYPSNWYGILANY